MGKCKCSYNTRGDESCSTCTSGHYADDCSLTINKQSTNTIQAIFSDSGQARTFDGIQFRVTYIGEFRVFSLGQIVKIDAKTIRCFKYFSCVNQISITIGDMNVDFVNINIISDSYQFKIYEFNSLIKINNEVYYKGFKIVNIDANSIIFNINNGLIIEFRKIGVYLSTIIKLNTINIPITSSTGILAGQGHALQTEIYESFKLTPTLVGVQCTTLIQQQKLPTVSSYSFNFNSLPPVIYLTNSIKKITLLNHIIKNKIQGCYLSEYSGIAGLSVQFHDNSIFSDNINKLFLESFTIEILLKLDINTTCSLWSIKNSHNLIIVNNSLILMTMHQSFPTNLLLSLGEWYKVLVTRNQLSTDIYTISKNAIVKRFTSPENINGQDLNFTIYLGQLYIPSDSLIYDWPKGGEMIIDNLIVWPRSLESTVIRDLWKMAITIADEFSDSSWSFNIDSEYLMKTKTILNTNIYYPSVQWSTLSIKDSTAPMDMSMKSVSSQYLPCSNISFSQYLCSEVYSQCTNMVNASRDSLIHSCIVESCRSENGLALCNQIKYFSCLNHSSISTVRSEFNVCACSSFECKMKSLQIANDYPLFITHGIGNYCVSVQYDGMITDNKDKRRYILKNGLYELLKQNDITCSVAMQNIDRYFRITSLYIDIYDTSIIVSPEEIKKGFRQIKINGTYQNVRSFSGHHFQLLYENKYRLEIITSYFNMEIYFIGRYIELYIFNISGNFDGLFTNSSNQDNNWNYLSNLTIYNTKILRFSNSLMKFPIIKITKDFTTSIIFKLNLYDIILYSFSDKFSVLIDDQGFISISCSNSVKKRTGLTLQLLQWYQLVLTFDRENGILVYLFDLKYNKIIRDNVPNTCQYINTTDTTIGGITIGRAVIMKQYFGDLSAFNIWSLSLNYTSVLQLRTTYLNADIMPNLILSFDASKVNIPEKTQWSTISTGFTDELFMSQLTTIALKYTDIYHEHNCNFTDIVPTCAKLDLDFYSEKCHFLSNTEINELLSSMIIQCKQSIRNISELCLLRSTNILLNDIIANQCDRCLFGISIDDKCECFMGKWGENCDEIYLVDSSGIVCSGNGIGNINSGECECFMNYEGKRCELIACAADISGTECEYSNTSYDSLNRMVIVGQVDYRCAMLFFNSKSIRLQYRDGYYLVLSLRTFTLHVHAIFHDGLRVVEVILSYGDHIVKLEISHDSNLFNLVKDAKIYKLENNIYLGEMHFKRRYKDYVILTIYDMAIEIHFRIRPDGISSNVALDSALLPFTSGILVQCPISGSSLNDLKACIDTLTSNSSPHTLSSKQIPKNICLSFVNSSLISGNLTFNIGFSGLTIEIYFKVYSSGGILFQMKDLNVIAENKELIIVHNSQYFSTNLILQLSEWTQLNIHWSFNGTMTLIIFRNNISSLTTIDISPLISNFTSTIEISDMYKGIQVEVATVRLWSRPYVSSIISNYVLMEISESTIGLLYGWTFNHGSGREVFDSTFNNKMTSNSQFPNWISCDIVYKYHSELTSQNNINSLIPLTKRIICLDKMAQGHRKICLDIISSPLKYYFLNSCIDTNSLFMMDDYCNLISYALPINCKSESKCCKFGEYHWKTEMCRCSKGVWGELCDKKCPSKCINDYCTNGVCECNDQWLVTCDQCTPGWVGIDCGIYIITDLKGSESLVQGNLVITLDGISYNSASMIGHFMMLSNVVSEIQMVFNICYDKTNCRILNEIVVIDKINDFTYNINSDLTITRSGTKKSEIVVKSILDSGFQLDLNINNLISITFLDYFTIHIAKSSDNKLYSVIQNQGVDGYTGILGNGNQKWLDDVNFGIHDHAANNVIPVTDEILLDKYLSLEYLTSRLYTQYLLTDTTSQANKPPPISRRYSQSGHMLAIANTSLLIDDLHLKLLPLEMFDLQFYLNIRNKTTNDPILTIKFTKHDDLILSVVNSKWHLLWNTTNLDDLLVHHDEWLHINIKWFSINGSVSMKNNYNDSVSISETYQGERVHISSIIFTASPSDLYYLDDLQITDVDQRVILKSSFNEGRGNTTTIEFWEKNGERSFEEVTLYDSLIWTESSLYKPMIDQIQPIKCNGNIDTCSGNEKSLKPLKIIYSNQCELHLIEYYCSTLIKDMVCLFEEPISKVTNNIYYF